MVSSSSMIRIVAMVRYTPVILDENRIPSPVRVLPTLQGEGIKHSRGWFNEKILNVELERHPSGLLAWRATQPGE